MRKIRKGDQVFHCRAFTKASASLMRRLRASSRAKAMSAVASVTTPGVLPAGMPRAVQAGRSRLSTPTA